mmetsp:Transcript_25161/g.72457  ORF Transcript_25161/g.72457 Transcript_25161/m.72457 type:complete len:206 (+) Transcript_25161:2428-3045(+)
MRVADLDQIIVALSGSLLVGDECQLRIQRFAVRTKDLGIVEHVVDQERFGITVEGDVDLSEGIVGARLRASGGDTGLQPRLKKAKTVSGLSNLHKVINRTRGTNRHQNALDEVLVRSQVKKLSNNLRSLRGRHFCNVDLDVLQETVKVEVLSQFINEVETVTHMDQWTRIRKLGSLQVFLDFVSVVYVGVSADTLRFLELSKHAR